jgi:hypothetical protein
VVSSPASLPVKLALGWCVKKDSEVQSSLGNKET